MSTIIRTTFGLQNTFAGTVTYGTLPQAQEEVASTSNKTHQTVQMVGTTEEQISVGDVPNLAMCIVKNLHATAVVTVGLVVAAVYYPLIRIPAGETAKLPRLDAVASVHLRSSVASTPVLVSLYEIA